MRPRWALLLALALAPAAIAPGSATGAGPPAPLDLTVGDGEESWHPARGFHLEWRNPVVAPNPPLAAVRYRVRDQIGAVVVAETRIEGVVKKVADLRVPDLPGSYTAEVWLEDAGGGQGPAAAAKLRFDDARPPHASPRQPPGWIGRAGFPRSVRVDLQPGPLPISGIRGYAVSVDRDPDGEPCVEPGRCTDPETDLRGGIGDDAFAIGELAEGTSYVHVVAVSGAGVRSAQTGRATLRVDKTDPTARLGGLPAGWANRSVPLVATATDAGSGMRGGGAFTAIRVDGGAPALAAGDSVHATVIEPGVHEIAFYARDAAGNVNDGGTVNGQPNRPPATATVRIDRAPPSVAFGERQDPDDPERIEARVADPLSGPSVERGRIGVRRRGSGDPFEALPTAVLAGGLRAEWDSEAYPPGEYEFEATGYDAAGNARTAGHRLDGARMVLSNPLKATTSLRAGFGGATLVWHSCTRRRGERRCRREAVSAFERRPARRIVPYGRGTLFSGRLRTGLGAPLEGVPVRIVERLGPRPGPVERVATARTGGGGTFSVRLAPGPSREIAVRFDGTRTLQRAAARTIRLGVRSGVRLRVSSRAAVVGGRPVVFSGKVLAGRGEIPAEGKSVALQFRLPGTAWTEFRTVQTDRRGRFRYPYRFSDDDSRGARFRFRAHAPAQGDWPYEPGSSRPVAVLGA